MYTLHSAHFEIRNVKRNKVRADKEKITETIRDGPPSLIQLGVNGVKWEVSTQLCDILKT